MIMQYDYNDYNDYNDFYYCYYIILSGELI